MNIELCERCKSPMQYTITKEAYNFGIEDTDWWLCLFCGNETITTEQIRINDARFLKRRADDKKPIKSTR